MPIEEITGTPEEAERLQAVQPQRIAPDTPVLTGRDAGLGASTIAGFSSNPEETMRFLAQELFPQEPLENAVKRFGIIDDRIVYRGDDGNIYEALPSSGFRGAVGRTLQGAGSTLPVGAGTATGIGTMPLLLTGPAGMAGSMGLTAGAAALGETARQKIGDFLMGEASTGDIAAGPVIQEATTSALGQGIGTTFTKLAQREAARDIARFNRPATEQAFAEATEAGVDLTPAEASGLQSQIARQKFLAGSPDTSDTLSRFYQGRSNQVILSFQRFLDDISGAADAEDVGIAARDAAQGVLDEIRDRTLTQARPLYEAAYEAGDRELWSPTLERLTGSPSVRSAMRRAVTRWQDEAIADGFGAMNPVRIEGGGQIKFGGAKGPPAFPNLQFWDYTKRALDRQAAAAATAGKASEARTIGNIARQLRSAVDEMMPNNEWARARKVYGTGADALETSMESALGVLADTKDEKILNAARAMFNPRTRSPAMVARLKSEIGRRDPEAWNAITRLYMQDIFTDAMRVSQKGEIPNIPGKIVSAFGNQKLRQNLKVALEPEQWRRFNLLNRVFANAARVADTNSDTAFKQLEARAAREGARPWYAGIARNLNPAQALRSFEEWRTDANLARQSQAMADLITSGDPNVIKQMRALQKLSPTDARYRALVGHILSQTGLYGAGALLPGENRAPAQ